MTFSIISENLRLKRLPGSSSPEPRETCTPVFPIRSYSIITSIRTPHVACLIVGKPIIPINKEYAIDPYFFHPASPLYLGKPTTPVLFCKRPVRITMCKSWRFRHGSSRQLCQFNRIEHLLIRVSFSYGKGKIRTDVEAFEAAHAPPGVPRHDGPVTGGI